MFLKLKKDYLGQKAGTVVEIAEEPITKSLIEQGVAEALAGNPIQDLLAKSMEGMLATLTKTLNESLDASMKEFAKAQTKSLKNKIPAIFGAGEKGDPNK